MALSLVRALSRLPNGAALARTVAKFSQESSSSLECFALSLRQRGVDQQLIDQALVDLT